MAQKILSVRDVLPYLPEGFKWGWAPVFEGPILVAFENRRFGRLEPSVVCEVDDKGNIKPLYDNPRWEDGPIGEDNRATPGTILVGYELHDDGYYLWVTKQPRPIIRDHVTGEDGVVIEHSFPGGFAAKVGDPEGVTATQEALEEAGIEFDPDTLVHLGHASSNRAFFSTCANVVAARVVSVKEAKPDKAERILGKQLIRADKFQPGLDALVNNAHDMFMGHFGLWSAVPQSDEVHRFSDLASHNPKAARLLLDAYESLSGSTS